MNEELWNDVSALSARLTKLTKTVEAQEARIQKLESNTKYTKIHTDMLLSILKDVCQNIFNRLDKCQ